MKSGSSMAVLDNAESPASIDLNVSSNSSHQSETTLTRTYRVVGQIILLSTAAAALLCSIYTTLSCRFLTIQGISSNQSVLSLNTKSIGIFSYSTLENGNSLNFSHCIPYENQFWLSDFGPFFWTTQFAAFLAPCFGGLAFVIQSVEIFQNLFLGNFVLSVILYLMASLVQGYTFLLYGAFDFWYVQPKKERIASQ